jgi:adenylate kinase
MVRVALTGTPGVGKTSLAQVAAKHGWRVVDVKAFARQQGCIAGHDAEDEADAIDVERLAAKVPPDDGSKVLYEGHLSHFLDLDEAWVVRCDPQALQGRLLVRGYSLAKVRENMEAEALDLILQEALDIVPRVIQRDGTRRTPEGLFAAFADSHHVAAKGHDLEPVDWSSQLPF